MIFTKHTRFSIEHVILLFVFFYISYFTWAYFGAPYVGFNYSASGKINNVYSSSSQLKRGDTIETVGEHNWEAYASGKHLFSETKKGSELKLKVNRAGENQDINIIWIVPGLSSDELLSRFVNIWWLPFVFLFAGLITLFFVRPKNLQWWFLFSFFLVTAVWLASNFITWQVSWPPFLSHAGAWLAIPIYLLHHWLFPRPITQLPKWVVGVSFLPSLLLIILEGFSLLPANLYLTGLLISFFGMFVLSSIRLMQPSRKPEDKLLLIVLFFVFAPAIAGYLSNSPNSLASGLLIGITIIPGAYFYTLFWRQNHHLTKQIRKSFIQYVTIIFLAELFLIGLSLYLSRSSSNNHIYIGIAIIFPFLLVSYFGFTPILALALLNDEYIKRRPSQSSELEFRTNRQFIPFVFPFILILTAGMIMSLIILWPGSSEFGFAWRIATATLITLALGLGYQPFQKYIQHKALRLPRSTSLVAAKFASRIGRCTGIKQLSQLYSEELLPELLVRESAILYLDEFQNRVIVFTKGVHETDLPNAHQLAQILKMQTPDTALKTLGLNGVKTIVSTLLLEKWVHLMLPFKIADNLNGVWLLGRRDPDDVYTHSELPRFQQLLDQTAVALSGFIRAINLRALNKANIGRDEAARLQLARELHDVTLNQITAIRMLLDDHQVPPEFQKSYELIIDDLRRFISGLRPTMLNLGLWTAFDQLAEELSSRYRGMDILFDLSRSPYRYPDAVEIQLFRIIQQAVQNSLRHAAPTTIRLYGELQPNQINLHVEDDGIGFATDGLLSLPTLLAKRQFGLAGMHERAEIIKACLHITSEENGGTQVSVIWRDRD